MTVVHIDSQVSIYVKCNQTKKINDNKLVLKAYCSLSKFNQVIKFPGMHCHIATVLLYFDNWPIYGIVQWLQVTVI